MTDRLKKALRGSRGHEITVGRGHLRLRRSREMTHLCSPKVTQHHQSTCAAFAARQERSCPCANLTSARVADRTLHHSVTSATDQGFTDAARARLLPR